MKKILMLITCLSYGDDKGGFDFISWSKWVEKRNKPPKKIKVDVLSYTIIIWHIVIYIIYNIDLR